ncbi:MAG: peptidylprolyl isomerase [Gemmatimonadetes bacterium]|nr:peptidylprolyl isomerase [Gemmatimonadota bacterium]
MLRAAVAALFLVQGSPDTTLTRVDRVVAVVRDTVILESEIQEQLLELQAMGVDVPRDPLAREAFGRRILEQKIDELVVLLRAREENITVTDAEVDAALDEQLSRIRRRFDSEFEFLRALEATGRTLAEFRLQLGQRARNERLIQRFLESRQSELIPEPVSPGEIEQFFETQKAAFGPKAATISFVQIVIRPQPSEEARARARAEAEEVLAQARAGADFEVLARRHSDDSATRDEGGDLGWFRRGMMVKPFEEAAYRLRPGELSGVVETSFGFHIIKLERVRSGERRARHILIRSDLADADIARAAALADSLAQSLREGTAAASELAARFGDPEEQVDVQKFPRDRLPAAYAERLQNAQLGDVVGPLEIQAPGNVRKWAVLHVTDLEPAGEWTLDDLRDTIRAQLGREKALAKLVRKLRQETYVEIRI